MCTHRPEVFPKTHTDIFSCHPAKLLIFLFGVYERRNRGICLCREMKRFSSWDSLEFSALTVDFRGRFTTCWCIRRLIQSLTLQIAMENRESLNFHQEFPLKINLYFAQIFSRLFSLSRNFKIIFSEPVEVFRRCLIEFHWSKSPATRAQLYSRILRRSRLIWRN